MFLHQPSFLFQCVVLALPLRKTLSGVPYWLPYFKPFEVETLGPWGSCTHSVFKEILNRLVDTSRDPTAGFYFDQKLSIAIQRTPPVSSAHYQWQVFFFRLKTLIKIFKTSIFAFDFKLSQTQRQQYIVHYLRISISLYSVLVSHVITQIISVRFISNTHKSNTVPLKR